MEEIQESCLDELLRISTKRLQSIIDGTECPSDTESSCDDSDVQHQEGNNSITTTFLYKTIVFSL